MAVKPVIHGVDHSPGGADPLKSWGANDGDVLTSDGAGAVAWEPVSGSGIQFGVDNVGNWLDIRTNSTDPDGYGIKLVSSGDHLLYVADYTVNADHILFDTTAASFSTQTFHGDSVYLQGDTLAQITSTGTAPTNALVIQASAGGLQLIGNQQMVLQTDPGGDMYLESGDTIQMFAQGKVEVRVGQDPFSGDPVFNLYHDTLLVFQVDTSTNPATYHIQTGATIDDDLPLI